MEQPSFLPSVTNDTCGATQGGTFFPHDGTFWHGGTSFLTPQALILSTVLFDTSNTFSSSSSLVYPVITRELTGIPDSQDMENFVRRKYVVMGEMIIFVIWLVIFTILKPICQALSQITDNRTLFFNLHSEVSIFFRYLHWSLFLNSQISYSFNNTEISRDILWGEIFFHQINTLQKKEWWTEHIWHSETIWRTGDSIGGVKVLQSTISVKITVWVSCYVLEVVMAIMTTPCGHAALLLPRIVSYWVTSSSE